MHKTIRLSLVALAAWLGAVAAMSPNIELVAQSHAKRQREAALRGDPTPLEGTSTGETLDVEIPGLGTATGHYLTTLLGKKFAAFHSLPYAPKPDRFEYAELWDETKGPWVKDDATPYDATRLRDRCPQASYLTDGASGDEDCLQVSIYSPLTDLTDIDEDTWKGRPVIFFIHGGSYTSGEATLYMPSKLMDQDAVVAVVQYRLGTFGFLYSGTEDAPGNFGLHDQVLAIRWVHRYAQYFGGDPDLITVMGQSAGSASTSLLMTSPLLQPAHNAGQELVQRFITMSGSALEYWTLSHSPSEDFETQLKAADCLKETTKESVDCMRDLSVDEMVRASYSVYIEDRNNGGLGFIGVVPVVQTELQQVDDQGEPQPLPEGYTVLPRYPSEVFQDGDFVQKPVMMGSTRDEGSMVAGLVWSQYLFVNGYHNDSNFLEFYLLPAIAESFGLQDASNSLANAYQLGFFPPGVDLGDWNQTVGGFVDVCGMLMLKTGMWTQAHLIKNASSEPVFFYSFEYESELNTMFPLLVSVPEGADSVPVPAGITHTDDLLYLFNLPGYFDGEDKEMVKKITTLYYNFAKYGNPTPPEAEASWSDWTNAWPEFDVHTKRLQVLAKDVTSASDYTQRWNYNMYGYPDMPVQTAQEQSEGHGSEKMSLETNDADVGGSSTMATVVAACGGVVVVAVVVVAVVVTRRKRATQGDTIPMVAHMQ